MTNIEKYKNACVESLDIPLENVERATMDSVTSWDSIGQMSLIAMLEEAFNIELKPDDIIGFNSYNAGFVILKKYGIEI